MLTSSSYRQLRNSAYMQSKIYLYRLFCYGFRTGGYLDVVLQKLQILQEEVKESSEFTFLSNISDIIKRILALREEVIPTDNYIIRRFRHYVRLFENALSIFDEFSLKDRRIKELDEIFSKLAEIVMNSKGLYILNWDNPFLLENGIIDLPDQGIQIIQGLFANDFSLNYAIVNPGGSFYHDHDSLWEYHFIDQYSEECLYEHYRAGKKYKIRDNDIIFMAPNIPHGGINPDNSISFRLGFVSGSSEYGPWRFDFNDRGAPPISNLESVEKIAALNGVHLDAIIKEVASSTGSNFIKDIRFPEKESEIEIKIIKIHDNYIMNPSQRDKIIKVLSGKGVVNIDKDIEQEISENDSFIIPSSIQVSITSNNMMMIVFG